MFGLLKAIIAKTGVAILLALTVSGICFSQTVSAEVKSEDQNIKEADIELSVPDSPALAVLGLTSQTVLRPVSPKEFATAILNGVDADGIYHTGLAIDTVPYLLMFGNEVTLRDYRDSFGTRALSRLGLSLATAKAAAEGDKASRLSVGLHWVIWDEGDPRLDEKLTECFNTKLLFPPLDPTLSLDQREQALYRLKQQYKDTLEPIAETCRSESRKRNWNASALDVGAAPVWISKDGTTGNLEWGGAAVWVALAYGFEGIKGLEDRAQFILQGQYHSDEETPGTVSETFVTSDRIQTGGLLRIGSPDFAVSLEGVYIDLNKESDDDENYFRVSATADIKVGKNVWLELGIGGTSDRNDGNDQTFILSQLKWSFSEKPALIEDLKKNMPE